MAKYQEICKVLLEWNTNVFPLLAVVFFILVVVDGIVGGIPSSVLHLPWKIGILAASGVLYLVWHKGNKSRKR